MPDARQTIRIFISSPGDVVEEREQARRVIEGLQRQYTGVTLQPVLWEELALPATASFQESIDYLLKQRPVDLAVFVLWSRLGSPLGPAISRPDGTPYRSGTEREFELMLAAFDQSGRKSPIILAYTRDDYAGFQQRLAQAPSSELEQLISQRKLAEQFIREQFQDAEGHNLRANYTYHEPIGFAQRLRVHLRQSLDDLLGADTGTLVEEPYRALEAFHEEHARIFYGRDEETCDVLERLRDQDRAGSAFVVIIGASGSGKSSLARAGVAASLSQHAVDDGVKQWRTLCFVPALEADDLFLRLTRSLAQAVPEMSESLAVLADLSAGLKRDAPPEVRLGVVRAMAAAVARALARAAEKAGGPVRLLLVLDQMEELWTDRRITPEDRERFFDGIEALARSGLVLVLATLRSDFYPHAQQMPAFVRMKGERGHYDLLPPDAAALHRLIVEPARLAGVTFERNEQTGRTLDEFVLHDAVSDPGALPLLQYALSEMFRQRDRERRLLTYATYQAIGGVEGALGKRADELFEQLPPPSRAALPEILPLLVTIDVAGEQAAVRRQAPLAELTATPERRALAESLITARFLTTDREDSTPVAGLAHEALLRRWGKIADWIAVNREHLRLRARVEQSQQRWEAQGRDESLLLPPGLPLEEARQLQDKAAHLLTGDTANYIRASIALDERHVMQTRRRRRAVISGLSILTLLATLAAIYASTKQREANQRRLEAVQAKNDAIASEKKTQFALRQSQFQNARALFEGGWANYQQGNAGRALLQMARSCAVLQTLTAQKSDAADVTMPQATTFASSVRRHILAVALDRRCPLASIRHENRFETAAFSSDGTKVATVTDKSVQLSDVATGRPLAHPLLHDAKIRAVAFSPDGTKLVTGSDDKTARLWDVASGNLLGQPILHGAAVATVAFSPDGTKLATGAEDDKARVWDTATGRLLLSLTLKTGVAVDVVAFSPDGTKLATAEQFDVQLWDVADGKPLGEPLHAHEYLNAVAFSPDGTKLAVGGGNLSVSRGSAELWTLATGQQLGELMRHENMVYTVAFSPDGTELATASWDNTARLWDAATGLPLGEPLRHEDYVRALGFSRDGTKLATASGDTVQLWDLTSPRPAVWHAVGMTVAFSPDGTKLATGSKDGLAQLWDAATLRPLGEPLAATGLLAAVAFNPAGTKLATVSDDKTAQLWDVVTRRPLGKPLPHEGYVNDVAFSRDGTKLATCDFRAACLWDVATGRPLGKPLPLERVSVAAFNPDATMLATGSNDGYARLWDLTTALPLGKPLLNGGAVQGVAFSPDGTKLATAGGNKIARIWDVATGQPLGEPLRHDSYVIGVTFSPDGTQLATGSFDKTARLWDVATSRPLGEPLRHNYAVAVVAFNPDATKIATACWDDTTWLWNLNGSLDEPAERLELWAETITAGQLDESGRFVPLHDEQVEKKLQRLSQLGGPPRAYLQALARRALLPLQSRSATSPNDAPSEPASKK